MKKSIFAVVVLLCIIAALPIIGNSFIQKSIDERLVELESFGLEITQDSSVSSYLHTSRHFEFVLKDSQTFLKYLQHYSDNQLPPYVDAVLNGAHIGTDIKYSNLPFAKAFEVDIYPIQLSPNMTKRIKENDLAFYNYIDKFLAMKGFLYHIEYNLLNEDFKGYIKDIQETYTLKDNTKIKFTLEKANFKGNGILIAPNEFSSKIKEMQFDVLEDERSINIILKDFKTSSNFESANTYLTNVDVKSALVKLKGSGNDVNLSVSKFRVNASSNEQGAITQLNSKTSIKHLEFISQVTTFTMKDFNFDVALNGLDKLEYKKFTTLISKNNVNMTKKSTVQMQTSMIELLSKGVVLNIADFSLKEFSQNTSKPLKGFKMQATLSIKEDKNLAKKMQSAPLNAVSNISLESEIKISKELYEKLDKKDGILARFDGYEKEDGDDYIFLLKFLDTKASINGRSIN